MERVKRCLTNNHICPLCHVCLESMLHLLRDCPRTMIYAKASSVLIPLRELFLLIGTVGLLPTLISQRNAIMACFGMCCLSLHADTFGNGGVRRFLILIFTILSTLLMVFWRLLKSGVMFKC